MRRTMPARVLLVVVLVAVLAACSGDGNEADATPVPRMNESLDVRMGRLDQSLRDEAKWLWDNMNYARTNPRPDADRCAAREWEHRPVVMDAEARRLDPTASRMVDHLDYATTLIGQARDEWARHCRDEISAMNVVIFLESRLTPAYQSLNIVRDALDRRAASH
jgi:hypothetical protein